MKRFSSAPLLGASIVALCSLLAACGGGGGGGGGTPPTISPSGTSSPTSPPTTPPPPTPTPGASGALSTANGALAANSTVIFTCGCSGQAGQTTTSDANGDYSLPNSSNAIPATPNPTYTLSPGRNYVIVGYQQGGTQSWTMKFLGKSPATNVGLGSVSSAAQAASALFIYYDAAYNPAITGGNHTFDWFDIRKIAAWAQKLDSGAGLTMDEQNLMNHVTAQQKLNASLYPGFVPSWNPQAGAIVNPAITTDVKNIMVGGTAADPALPTPCAGGPQQCSPTP